MRSDEEFSVIVAGTVIANEFELVNASNVTIMELGSVLLPDGVTTAPSFVFRHLDAGTTDSYLAWTTDSPGTTAESLTLAGPTRVPGGLGPPYMRLGGDSASIYPSVDLWTGAAALALSGLGSAALRSNGLTSGPSLTLDAATGDATLTANSFVAPRTWVFDGDGWVYLDVASGTRRANLRGFDGVSSSPYYCRGPLLGPNGFAVVGFGGAEMGYRDAASGTRYAWVTTSMMIGTAPNDSLNTHALRVQGSAYMSADDIADRQIGRRTSGSLYYENCIYAGPADYGGGSAGVGFHPGGVAPQLRVGPSVDIIYVRNFNDGAYSTLQGFLVNVSSRRHKQDIASWPPVARSVGAAAAQPAPTALDLIDRLRPVSYRHERRSWLGQVPSGRRERAYRRLNGIRAAKGLGPFESDELVHECGRDCDGTTAEPCARVRDWQTGQLGLIAEEVGEVAPELAHLGPDGTFDGLDAVAVATLALAGIRELRAEVAELRAELGRVRR